MKRSERLFRQSREYGVMSVITLMASVAIVSWVPMSILSGDMRSWGALITVGMGAFGLIGIALAFHLGAEACRLSRMGYKETRWEWQREVRPRL